MRAVAVAHPNVALVKYWGKRARAGNLPATGSLSLVLGGLATETSVQFDPALIAALQSQCFYIGALGSSRTHARRVARLSEAGLADAIPRIHAPVGLDLGGRSPAEIAVSVLAQVIQSRYAK